MLFVLVVCKTRACPFI